jgi:hypothetical protein
MFAGAAPPPVTCEELGSLKVPVLVMRGQLTRANFALGDDMLLNCLSKGTELAVVPNGLSGPAGRRGFHTCVYCQTLTGCDSLPPAVSDVSRHNAVAKGRSLTWKRS